MLRVICRISLAATATLTALAFAGVHVLPVIVAPIFVALSCQGFSNGTPRPAHCRVRPGTPAVPRR